MATAKEKLYDLLARRPAGAGAEELANALLDGVGSDPETPSRVVRTLLENDPNFRFDAATDLWSLSKNDHLRVPLGRAQFVVVDLETTGGPVAPGSITEIGAYRMVGQRVAEQFQSLVRPRRPISRFVERLTAITNEMVAAAPPIEEVAPAFRTFLGDAVMVAHNAPFDFGFLDLEFRRLFGIGINNPVLCTLRMSRRFVPSLIRRRLDLLAAHFGLSTEGRHRALGDARMTSELLAIFLDIAEKAGIGRLDRLLDHVGRAPHGRWIERHVGPQTLAQIPPRPGVYLMRNGRGDLLYVGKARRLKERVGSYFAATLRLNARTAELVAHVRAIETRVTRSALEAALLEARLIREHKPPYNRMLKGAAPAYFLLVDLDDPFARLTLASSLRPRPGLVQFGPFIGRSGVERATRALSRVLGLRTCAGRITPDRDFSPCIYGQMGQCAAPCNASIGAETYGGAVRRAVEFMRGRNTAILRELVKARDQAASVMRFNEASRLQRDLEALVAIRRRIGRLSQVVSENNLVIVTGEAGDRGAHVVLSGRLALSVNLDSPERAGEIASFVAANYARYAARPVARGELEAMTIVARWLCEREPDEGRLIYLGGPSVPAESLLTMLDG